MATVERDLTTGGPQELQHVATIRKNLGHEWRVAVKTAGHGPAIDVREYVTADAYPTIDTLPADAHAKGYRKRTKADGYVGPTRAGLWMSVPQAIELMDAVAAALDAAETFVYQGRSDLS